MSEPNVSPHQNPTLQPLFRALDPISLILSQNSSHSDHPVPLKLTTETFYMMERGPRYEAYAELRESKLRMKSCPIPDSQSHAKQTPPKKQVKFQFQPNPGNSSRKGSSFLAQSVPDFAAALRKENRKPQELTPPPSKNWSKVSGMLRGSKSANGGEKRGGGMVGRKSYAGVEELKGLAMAAANGINGENRGGRGMGKNVLGCRQL